MLTHLTVNMRLQRVMVLFSCVTTTLAPRDIRGELLLTRSGTGPPATRGTGGLRPAFLPGSKKTRACGSARRASATYDQLPAQGSQRHRRARSFRPAAL